MKKMNTRSVESVGRYLNIIIGLICFTVVTASLQSQVREGDSALYYPLGMTETTLPPSTALNLTDEMTIEAWIKPDGWGEGPNYIGTIFQKPSIWLFIVQNHAAANDSSLILQLRHATGVSHSYSEVGSIRLDEWSHIAVSYDQANSEVSMLINGHPQEIGHISLPSGPIRMNTSETMHIGSVSGGIMGFMGVLDELRIWNLARTVAEIDANMGFMLEDHQVGLQAYWPMNEGGGNMIHDMSGNAHDITLSGVEWTYGTPFHATSITDPDPQEILPELDLHTYPNPFNPELVIKTVMPRQTDLQIRVYNSMGQEVWSEIHENHPPGAASFKWKGVNHSGTPLSSGLYLISMITPDQIITRKNLLLR